jgi:8-oxo-dGTP pyrophosphatase MutT (NUDIX family)
MQSTLLDQLQNYQPFDEHESRMAARLRHFLETAAPQNPFERELAGQAPEHGHVTGSAWIVNPQYTKCLLLHHAKLGKWVQPGGHCDGEADVLNVARREVNEETGLIVTALQEEIFDVDIHEIPEYWNTPAHLHFDVRYLFVADPEQQIVSNHESRGIRWLSLDEACELSDEESILRLVKKTKQCKSTFALR